MCGRIRACTTMRWRRCSAMTRHGRTQRAPSERVARCSLYASGKKFKAATKRQATMRAVFRRAARMRAAATARCDRPVHHQHGALGCRRAGGAGAGALRGFLVDESALHSPSPNPLPEGERVERVPLDIAPLFETVDDLKNAPATLRALLDDPVYREHLACTRRSSMGDARLFRQRQGWRHARFALGFAACAG
jgi:hypothetical protein